MKRVICCITLVEFSFAHYKPKIYKKKHNPVLILVTEYTIIMSSDNVVSWCGEQTATSGTRDFLFSEVYHPVSHSDSTCGLFPQYQTGWSVNLTTHLVLPWLRQWSYTSASTISLRCLPWDSFAAYTISSLHFKSMPHRFRKVLCVALIFHRHHWYLQMQHIDWATECKWVTGSSLESQ
jgi:hypothetical protein